MENVVQLFTVFVLVFLNGFFVASEYAFVSLRKTRIAAMVKAGSRRAKRIQYVQDHLDFYISAIQLGITFVSLMLGWIAEPYLGEIVRYILAGFLPAEILTISSHTLSVIISFLLITYMLIVLGELIPKSLTLATPERVALWVIHPIMLFAKIFGPFVSLLHASGKFVVKNLGLDAGKGKQGAHSEDEIKIILSQSAQSGDIEKKEAEMVYKVFKLSDSRIRKIMIPRKEIHAFSSSKTLRELEAGLNKNSHSRFPVYKNSLHTILGFVHLKDFYRALANDRNAYKPLAKIRIIRPILTVSETKELDEVLLLMRKKRIHMAIVRNKQKKTVGLVTLEDIVESLVGEIEDEFETSTVKRPNHRV